MLKNINVDLCYKFWKRFDKRGLVCWDITPEKITIEFCFDDENVNIEHMPCILNAMVEYSPSLLLKGWNLKFYYNVLKPDTNLNFSKNIELVLNNILISKLQQPFNGLF